MKHEHLPKRKIARVAAGVTAAAAAAVLLPDANASQSPAPSRDAAPPQALSARAVAEAASRLTAEFGSSIAGAYYDPAARRLVVNVAGDGDFVLVTYDDPGTDAPSQVDLGNGQVLPITGAADAAVGQEVFRMGSTTGLHGGSVLGLDATVN